MEGAEPENFLALMGAGKEEKEQEGVKRGGG